MNDSEKIPSTQEFCTEAPLYKKYDISECAPEDLFRSELRQETIDAYCLECGQPSVFRRETTSQGTPRPGLRRIGTPTDPVVKAPKDSGDRDFSLTFTCSRDSNHRMRFYFHAQNLKISKVGQYPSLADLQLQDLTKYRKILSPQAHREFSRAVRLYANGIGIGAFVYLRRIFENLIESAHQRAMQNTSWDERNFPGRIQEKIRLLRGYLPEMLVQNSGMYSILSKGIHSLSEDECLEYFTTVRLGIEMILDEEYGKTRTREESK
jgi:hypothetical protein